MFYSLAILTLLASILFYSFYPRNDGIKVQDMPRAKSLVTDMLAHHMAAVEAARVLSYDETTQRNKMAYENWASGGFTAINKNFYASYLPPNFASTTFNSDPTSPDPNGVPYLYCFNNSDGTSLIPCAQRKADIDSSNFGTSDYIITFMETDAGTLEARALGEKMHLTSYASNEHLKTICGIVDRLNSSDIGCNGVGCGDYEDYDYQGLCMVNNTRYQTVRLPRFFNDRDVCNGNNYYLVCITQLSAAYDGTTKVRPQ